MDLELIKIFIKVVQFNSFSKAGENLKLPKSTVSKAITKLEQETKTKLLLRTTRNLTLTPAGRAFFEEALAPIQQLEEAHKNLYGHDTVIAGNMKITAPEDLGSFIISPAVAELSIKHPELNFELEYTNQVIDLVKEGFDLAVRLGKLSESNFKVKRVGEFHLILVATPEYLKKNKKIKTPSDLKEHTCLSLNATMFKDHWILKSANGNVKVNIKSSISSNQMSSLLSLAVSGAGVAMVPNYLCQRYLQSKELIHVLPEWKSPGYPVSIVSPLASNTSLRLKITTEYLYQRLTKILGS